MRARARAAEREGREREGNQERESVRVKRGVIESRLRPGR